MGAENSVGQFGAINWQRLSGTAVKASHEAWNSNDYFTLRAADGRNFCNRGGGADCYYYSCIVDFRMGRVLVQETLAWEKPIAILNKKWLVYFLGSLGYCEACQLQQVSFK